MKLIGLMVARNEEWILGCSARAALRWCDELVILDHRSTDGTQAVISQLHLEHPGRIYSCREESEHWEERVHRQRTLDIGRAMGGTHFAIVDADEVLTANLASSIKRFFEELAPGEVLQLPMIPCWRSPYQFRNDASVWSHSLITAGFADASDLGWYPDSDGYQFHQRHPFKSTIKDPVFADMHRGGVMHLQFAHWPRLVAKHVWYRMVEHLRWPGKRGVDDLNRMYDLALDETGIKLSPCDSSWWWGHPIERIDPGITPWHDAEIVAMLATHGRERFSGLDLKGR